MEKHKTVFVNPRSNRNRIELNPTTIVDPNPLPEYTYGSGANETFPGIFPTVRKEGVGVAADVSTPTFSSSSIGEGEEIDFFDTKKKIKDIINKQYNMEPPKIYLKPGEKPPEGVQVMRGSKGGYYYLPGQKNQSMDSIEPKQVSFRHIKHEQPSSSDFSIKMMSGDKVAGKISYSDFGNGIGSIDSISIEPEFRKQDYGKKLFEKVFKSSNMLAFEMETSPVVFNKFFKKLGAKLLETRNQNGTLSEDDATVICKLDRDDFFASNINKQLDIEKAWINFQPDKGEKPPKGAAVTKGPRGGYYYQGLLPGRKSERSATSSQYWDKPTGNKSPGNVRLPDLYNKKGELVILPDSIMVNNDPWGLVQVTWVDAKGRPRQYGIKFASKDSSQGKANLAAKQTIGIVVIKDEDKDKWIREQKLGKDMKKIRSILERDKGKFDEALVLQVQFLSALRVGSEDDPSGDTRSYGVATLLKKHIKVNGDRCYIRFPGKDGKENHRIIKEPSLAKKVNNIKNPEAPVFKTDYKKINQYINKNLGDYKTHDFRRWNATELAIKEIKKYPMPKTEKEFHKIQREVGKTVGAYLYNGYMMSLNYYIWPQVWIPMQASLMAKPKTNKIKKEYDEDIRPFNSIYEMLNCVHCDESDGDDGATKVRGEIDGMLEKARIYLGVNGKLPPGKRLMFGSKGGRFYETELEVYRHFWERVRERKMKEEIISNAISYLDKKNFPSSEWWFKVEKDGIIVGHANQVQSVLDPKMSPAGIQINPE